MRKRRRESPLDPLAQGILIQIQWLLLVKFFATRSSTSTFSASPAFPQHPQLTACHWHLLATPLTPGTSSLSFNHLLFIGADTLSPKLRESALVCFQNKHHQLRNTNSQHSLLDATSTSPACAVHALQANKCLASAEIWCYLANSRFDIPSPISAMLVHEPLSRVDREHSLTLTAAYSIDQNEPQHSLRMFGLCFPWPADLPGDLTLPQSSPRPGPSVVPLRRRDLP